MGAWDSLSIREKAEMMKAAIRNGITTLPEIKQAYNEFAEGGNIYDGTKPHSSQMQKKYIYDVLPGLFAQDGVKISVTSGYRPGAVVRGTNKPSRHGLKQAADIVGDFDAIRRVLDDPNSNTSKWLLANGYGYLDETSKTGTTKFWHDKKRDHSHYHIGTDKGIVASYAKKMQKLLSELPQQQETVSMLPTAVTVPEFIPYNPQVFFGQQVATMQMPIESVDVPQEETATNQEPTEENNNFGTFNTIMELLNAATPQESVPVMAQAQAKASSPYIVNRFDKGGSKKSGGSFYQTHRARWFNFLRKKGVDPVKAERLATYFSAQDSLESGHGTSDAARRKNNYGGMQRLDKKTNKMVNVSYGSIDDYMNAKWKMMNSKYSRALNAKSVQEYANILNDPKYHGKAYMYGLYKGYRDGQPLDVARQTKYMNDYTRIMMDIAGEKGFKGADVPDDLSIVQPENPYTQFIPFEPFNPQVFNSPQAFVAPTREQFEAEQPIVEAAKDYAYSPEQLEKEERRQGLNNLSFILGMMNGGNGSSFADTIGMLTGNIAAKGGPIHIKPENRGKFTALKERTGHSATWFKEHGTPAQKKMATFALNSRHWKHGYGGHIYDGTTEDSQLMNTDGGPFSYIQRMLSDAQNMSRFARKPSYKEALRQAGERVERQKDISTTVHNDNTWVAGKHGKKKNPELQEYNAEALRRGAAERRIWRQEHPYLAFAGDVLTAAPLAVAAYPFVAGAGEALAGTAVGQAATSGLTWMANAAKATPWIAKSLPWIDVGLTSYFAAHGLDHAINEGIHDPEDAIMTGLELAPLGRLAKPLYEGVVQPGMRLFNSPLTGNWAKIGNREYRLSPNSLGANGNPIESRTTVPQITAENAASMTPEQWTAAQDAADDAYYLLKQPASSERFQINKGVYDEEIPEEVKQIYRNAVLPRMLRAHPDYYPLQELYKEGVEKALSKGYTVYPQEVFDSAGKRAAGAAGLTFSDGHIAVREGYEDFALGHELRHRLQLSSSPSMQELKLLNDAYDANFENLGREYPHLKDINLSMERETLNYDARRSLVGDDVLKEFDLDTQNAIIDDMSDTDVFEAVEDADAYGSAFIDFLRKNNLLTHKKAQQFREAMKHASSVATPIAVGLTAAGIASKTSDKK